MTTHLFFDSLFRAQVLATVSQESFAAPPPPSPVAMDVDAPAFPPPPKVNAKPRAPRPPPRPKQLLEEATWALMDYGVPEDSFLFRENSKALKYSSGWVRATSNDPATKNGLWRSPMGVVCESQVRPCATLFVTHK